ncbi:unnamed protein product [Cladocopium goreaui]|uniref:Ferric reduction oxidase 2 (AtFRO2) (Ferric-chelate reductase 2) (Protein FERRIC CHELATE REDUCTASE DEFECTIVE 1) n=1 Tax=Cladocopium goreaui TaxID=2562237 RepID=A0A9P1C7M9_9DINO|nr:unnamed protein product [Cladocopium goreaui]
MALFACQSLEGLPAELPTLTLVFCLVLSLVLVPGTVLTVSSLQWNFLLHSVGIITLAACIVKTFLLKVMKPNLVLKESLVFTGIVTGRAAAIYLGMMLLGISRRSIVSDWHGLDYPNLIAFHRVVGWWVLAMSILHSLAFGFYYLQKGGWFEVWQACLPVAVSCRGPEERDCWNILGLVNGFGVVATAVSILLGIFSQQLVRRGFYNLFYFTHLVSSFLFMLFCALHDFSMVILMFPGLVLYVRDRSTGLRSRDESTEVTVRILCSEMSPLVLLSWKPSASGSHLLPGTRWVYLREKTISGLQWHPYSIIFHGDRAYILLKGVGDWSRSLCNLATSGDTVRLGIEGPYGKPICNSTGTLQEERALLLLAGGVGISPFIDLIAALPDQGRWQRVKLVWAVRGEEYRGLVNAIDFQSLSQRAQISIFITSPLAVSEAGFHLNEGRIGSARQCEIRSEEGHRPDGRWNLALIIGGAVAADFLAHSWATRAVYLVRSFMAWALLMRVVPILLVATAVLLISMALMVIPRCVRYLCSVRYLYQTQLLDQGHSFPDRGRVEGLAGREISGLGQSLSVQHGKLDLHSLVEAEAQLGPVELKACGPERMLSAVTSTARLLNSRGHEIALENLEAEL